MKTTPTSSLPVTATQNRNRLRPRKALAILLAIPTLLLSGCIERVDTVEDLPVDEAAQAQIRQDFYTAVRETVEITTAYTGHNPTIYTHGTGRTFDIADVQPDSDYYPTMGCDKNPDGESLYMLDLNISYESQDYSPEEYKRMSDHMRTTWEEQGHDVQSITLRSGGIQSVYYTDMGTRVYYAVTARGDTIQVETACVMPETPPSRPSSS